VILIAAVLIGAIAAYALYNYVNGVEDRAYDNAKRVQVFVVKQPIAKGTPGDQAVGDKLVQAGQIPQEFRPATAITDTAVLNGKVALTNLVPGQVVVDGMFVDQATAFVTFSERIPVDQVAVTVSVDQVHGVAGLLVPGDKVNLMVVLDPRSQRSPAARRVRPLRPAVRRRRRHGPVPLSERRGARDRADRRS
jgi:pilus assembly protein CpaB